MSDGEHALELKRKFVGICYDEAVRCNVSMRTVIEAFLEEHNRIVHEELFSDEVLAGGGALKLVEKQTIMRVMEKCGGRQTRAAKFLGISRSTLMNKLNIYSLVKLKRGDMRRKGAGR